MPNDKLKRAISVALSFSMLTSAPQLGNAADLVPNNGMISSTPPCQTVIAPNDAAVGFSMKSFEAKISKALKHSKSVETEKVKRKTVKAEDAEGTCGSSGNVKFTFKAATGRLTISGNGAMSDYEYNNHAPWYSYRDSITSVTIGNGVTSIGNRAFEDCSSLTSVNIWNSITSLGDHAFSGCSTLASITIPTTVTSIGNFAFDGCSALTEISIPHSVTALGGNLFQGCTSLKSITFNNDYSLEQINAYTTTTQLKGQIEKIELGPSVTTIPSNMFYGFSKLASINIPHGVESIEGFAFQQCTSLTSITIPDTVTSIGTQAFNGCSSLASLEIGSGVKSIGSSAFSGCNALTSLEIGNDYVLNNAYLVLGSSSSDNRYDKITSLSLGYAVTSNPKNLISRLTNLQSINVAQNNDYLKSEDGVLFSKDGSTLVAYPPKKETTSYTIPDGVSSIGDSAFSGCSGLTEVTISGSVTSIGSYAFSDCNSLSSVTISDSVASIRDSAFSGCSALTSLKIGSGVTSIGSYAFSDCNALTSLEIGNDYALENAYLSYDQVTSLSLGNNVTSIPENFFYNFNNLQSINVSQNNDHFKSEDGLLFSKDGSTLVAYPLKKAGTSYTIPDGITLIGRYAFAGCSELTSITLGNGVESIGDFAFSSCSGLTEVTIPDSVTTIGVGAFSYCSGLTSITLGNGVESIGDCFWGCTALHSVNVNNNYIASKFSADSSLFPYEQITSIVLGDGVTSIENNAFQYGYALESVTIGKNVANIGSDAFRGCDKLSSITYLGINEPKYGSQEYGNMIFPSDEIKVNVPKNYKGNTFCGNPVNKVLDPYTPSDGNTDPEQPESPSGGGSNAGVIAGSVVAALAVVAAVAVTAVMYVKKLACFARPAASVSEGGAPAEEV